MKKFALKFSLCIVIVLLMLSACKDDDSASCNNGNFELTVNDEDVATSHFNNTLVKGNDGAVAGKRLDIRVDDPEGREFIITISDVSTGASGNGISTDEYISFDDVSGPDENTFYFTVIEDDIPYIFTDGTLDITACDPKTKQVSGTFSFKDGYEVSGTFTDMCYRIVK